MHGGNLCAPRTIGKSVTNASHNLCPGQTDLTWRRGPTGHRSYKAIVDGEPLNESSRISGVSEFSGNQVSSVASCTVMHTSWLGPYSYR